MKRYKELEEIEYMRVVGEKKVLIVYKTGEQKIIYGKITKKKLRLDQEKLL